MTSEKVQNYFVFLLCFGLFVSTFIMGYAPSIIKKSRKTMNLLAIFGGGLLIGAALEIIVPEGMQVLTQSMTVNSHDWISHESYDNK